MSNAVVMRYSVKRQSPSSCPMQLVKCIPSAGHQSPSEVESLCRLYTQSQSRTRIRQSATAKADLPSKAHDTTESFCYQAGNSVNDPARDDTEAIDVYASVNAWINRTQSSIAS